jgi:hypothetical protein
VLLVGALTYLPALALGPVVEHLNMSPGNVMTTAIHPYPATFLFDPALVRRALFDAFIKLNPAAQWRNPVMFVVYVCAA